jgi:F420H(2)-dependent quinone reductase
MFNLAKVFVKANVFIYQKTGGLLGSRMGKQSVLILHTIGRKSGKYFATTLSYYRDGANYLIVASNWGKENPPDWFLNLLQHSGTTIQVRNMILHVEAHPAGGNEYQRLWELVTGLNPQYLEYQRGLTRQIPIMILSPIADQK